MREVLHTAASLPRPLGAAETLPRDLVDGVVAQARDHIVERFSWETYPGGSGGG